jgi:hypothetical protein
MILQIPVKKSRTNWSTILSKNVLKNFQSLKGLAHEIEMGYKSLHWTDLSGERSRWWFLKFLNAP